MNSEITAPVLLTFDVDWAPDYLVAPILEMLELANVRSTWFVTHDSPVLDRCRASPELFQLGIHPNFLPGSSHGQTISEVLEHCLALVPEALVVRSHSLLMSSRHLATILETTQLTMDSSLLLPHAAAVEVTTFYWRNRAIQRYPIVWEDDIEMERPEPDWFPHSLMNGSGPRVFDFHPIHVALNHPDASLYETWRGLDEIGRREFLATGLREPVVGPLDTLKWLLRDFPPSIFGHFGH